MASYPGLPAYHYMPSGTWQANPWDTNPPLGTTPNIIWPQNQNPFQYQGGAAPWPHYNLDTLYPACVPPQGLPTACPSGQTARDLAAHTDVSQSTADSNTSSDADSITDYYKTYNSNLNANAEPQNICPCCGSRTNKVIKNYPGVLGESYKKYDPTTVSESLTSGCGMRTERALACSETSTSCTTRAVQSTRKTSETRSSKSNRRVHRNNNAQMQDNPVGNDDYMKQPQLAQYMQQMRAYQQSLQAVMAQYPANQSGGQNAVRGDMRGNRDNHGMQMQVGRADNYHPMTGIQGVQDAYQQSMQQMRNVQAMVQQAYQQNQTQPYTNPQPGVRQENPYHPVIVSPGAQAYPYTSYPS